MHRQLKLSILLVLSLFPVRAYGQFDAERLLNDLTVLSSDAFEGREAGSAGGIMARDYLREGFRSIGLQPCGAQYDQPFSFGARNGVEVEAANLIALIPGSLTDKAYVVITAHYDHVGIRNGVVYNGADDNASGAAALLAIGDHFLKSPPLHSIVIAALDAEEKGLRGARAFLEAPCIDRKAIWLNVNLDMISRSDANELYAAGTFQNPDMKPVLQSLGKVEGVDLVFGHDEPGTGRDNWTTASDQGPFYEAGIPFIYFGVEDHEDYHRPSDDADNIQRAFYISSVELIIDAISALDVHLQELHESSNE